MKINKWIILGIVMIISFLVLTLVVTKIIKENTTCSNDPFSYAAKKLKDAGGNYRCVCSSLDKELYDFSFDENGITILIPQEKTKVQELNISLDDLILGS